MTARASKGFRVDCDWRGETAYYIEGGRRVWMSGLYWGGRAGSVSHIHAVWEPEDGRREPLAADERAEVLKRVIQYVQNQWRAGGDGPMLTVCSCGCGMRFGRSRRCYARG